MSVNHIYNMACMLKKAELDQLIAKLQRLSANCIFYENSILPYSVKELAETPDPEKINHMVRYIASFAHHEFDPEDLKVQTIAAYLVRYIYCLIEKLHDKENDVDIRNLSEFSFWHDVSVEIIGDMVNSDKTIQEKIPDLYSLEKYIW
uniref:Uncharacterized protein n=1 Tax=viral metagenome TaxID=1070528 RepID=A0A6C0JVM9_9ZZZZ